MRPFQLRAVVNLVGPLRQEEMVPLLDAGLGSVWLRSHRSGPAEREAAEGWSSFLAAWPVLRIRSAAIWRTGCSDHLHLRSGERPPAGGVVASVTVHSLQDLQALSAFGSAGALVSPIFTPRSKPETIAPLGLNGLREIVARSERPCIAMGGLSAATLDGCSAAGAAGGAVLGALLEADSREALVAWLRARRTAA